MLEQSDAFVDLVNRELRDQVNEEERLSLYANEETLKRWEQVLRMLETKVLADITQHKEIYAIKKTKDLDVRQETWRREKMLRQRALMKRIRFRRQSLLPLIDAERQKREQQTREERDERHRIKEEEKKHNKALAEQARLKKEERRQAEHTKIPSSYATAYRRGLMKGVGYYQTLVERGVPPRQAFELCMDYAHTELEVWRDTYEVGTPPPPFPHVLEEIDETSM